MLWWHYDASVKMPKILSMKFQKIFGLTAGCLLMFETFMLGFAKIWQRNDIDDDR